MKSNIMMKASRLMHGAGLTIKKHSPEIFMTVGIVGTVASTVLACKATTKVGTILEETKTTVDIIHDGMEKGDINGKEYTKDDGKKDLTIVYAQTGVKLAKLYAPAIAVGTLSIASIVWGHNILKKRNIALAAAYAVVDKGFKDYRKNVVDRFGQEIDKELRFNIKAKEIETEVEDEKGNKTTKKEIVNVAENPSSKYSDFARVWECGNPGWTKDAQFNLLYLRKIENYFNDVLKTRGYVFLNEVYEMLGYQKTPAGQIVGWKYNNKENKYADNYIDFGIYNINRQENCDFINGYERSIVLDFNVDGPIHHLI